MKYKKLIIILAVALVLFIGGGLLYSALSENMKNDTVLTGTDDSDITSTTIGITAVTETSDASSSSASTTDSGNTSATSSTSPS